jgi:flagella basal body P-ring formation protein FlgA
MIMMQKRFEILRRLPLLLAVVLIAVGGGAGRQAAAQTTVTLNLSARMSAADAPVTLAGIARLEGPEARRFGEVVVLERADAKQAVSLADVRATLQAAGANFGTLTLRGSSCRIELPGAAPAAAKPAMERSKGGPDFEVVDIDGPPTIRTAIARRLAAMHGVAHDAIQLAFDEKDRATLATPHSDRQTVHVQPAASASSSRVPLRISVYVGDRVIADYRLTADILLRREVLVATREIERRELISDPDVRLEPRWIPPGENPPDRGAVVGSEARARIKEGSTFKSNAVESPVLIRRGDVVYVECLSGSMVVRARAKALGAGREGETIAFQMDGADDSFMARVAGRGRAVMLAVAAFDGQARVDEVRR